MRIAVLALVAFGALPARAVDHTENIFGLGVSLQQVSNFNRPAQLSVRMAVQPRIEGAVVFGARLGQPYSTFSPGIKGHYILLPEKHLNLYAAIGVGADIQTVGGLSAFWYQAGPGIEAFLETFPNLGFFFEFGFWGNIPVGATTENASYVTTGVGSAGLHYWF